MVYNWLKGGLKKLYFEHGTPYVGAVLMLGLFVVLAVSRAIALPIFGAVGATDLANPAALITALGTVGFVALHTGHEISQRSTGAEIVNNPTPDTAETALDLLKSGDHQAREDGAEVLVRLIDDGAGLIVKRTDRSAEEIIGLILETLQVETREESNLHEYLSGVLAYFVRDYPKEAVEHQEDLKALLYHESPIVQENAVTIVGNLVTEYPNASGYFIGPISDLADDDDPRIRKEVCFALSRMSHDDAPGILRELANDSHPKVHDAATEMMTSQQSVSDEKNASSAANEAKEPQREKTSSSPEPEYVEDPPELDFGDVAGMEEVKSHLHQQVIVPFEGGDTYEKYGVSSVSGILFHGPPGTGKTYITECLAGELDVNFARISVSDIDSSLIGEGVENLDAIFTEARQNQPCIVFLDELDAIGSDRSSDTAHDERKRQVNQLLDELSNIDGEDDVIVVGASNNPDDIDSAILRTGRFDTKVEVPKPGGEARAKIFAKHVPMAVNGLTKEEFTRATRGFVASDIKEVANQAARQAAYRDQMTEEEDTLRGQDVFHAIDSIADDRGSVGEFIEQPPDMSFEDVAGMEDLKQTLRETIIQPLGQPDLFEEYGIGVEQGFLLYGPPGTGKTYITKCLAGEIDINYIEAKGSDLVSKWIGEGAKNVKRMFAEARANQPCLIFIDEIDSLATDRNIGNQQKSERQMVNQFLEELSTSHDNEDDVIVIGATNRPEAVDNAMLRSGRLGKKIEVPLPDGDARVGILKQHLEAPTDPLDEDRIKVITEGMASSEIEQIATTAARRALARTTQTESGKSAVTQEDIEEVVANIKPKTGS